MFGQLLRWHRFETPMNDRLLNAAIFGFVNLVLIFGMRDGRKVACRPEGERSPHTPERGATIHWIDRHNITISQTI